MERFLSNGSIAEDDFFPVERQVRAPERAFEFRDDVLFFATAGGRLSGDFMTVSAGRVGLYRTVGEGRSALRVTYPDVAAAVRAVRGVCLDRRNIGLARGDYRRYLESRGKASRREPDAARVARVKP